MTTMNVEQAIFASTDRGQIKGYQLVSKSAGIDRAVAQELCRWAPTQMPCSDRNKWAVSYFPISEDEFAVSRSVLGGPEYSNRGGRQVVTVFLILRTEQFAAYAYNPVAVVKTAIAMGYMRLPTDVNCKRWPAVKLPDQPIFSPGLPHDHSGLQQPTRAVVREMTRLHRSAQRFAVIGCHDPINTLAHLIPRLSVDSCREFSFTTGLLPSIRRPFRAHFLATADTMIRRTLESQEIVEIRAR